MSRGRFTLLALCVIVFAASVSGQTHRASIRGIVVDPAGAVVPQVNVKVVSETTAETRSGVSDPAGRFAVPILAPGRYLVEVEHQGYRKHVSRLDLQVNQDLWLDIALTLGSLNQEVLVNAPTAPLEKESARLSTVIDTRQVMGLPLDGRNVLELSLLAPGASPAPQGSASSLRGDFAFSVNGGREDAQSFLLDGVYNIDPKLNTPGVRPPVDAIRAFEVLSGTYDASFGRNGAGQVNVVTHSGTNNMHGTVYGFVRTQALEARNFFAPAGEAFPAYNRGQFGASLGGPIRRNRTFFFADYERTQLREGITRVTNVPTAAERAGDFSQSLLPAPINPVTRQPFDGKRIPDFFIHPVGRAIAALYPLPNRSTPFANFVSSPRLDDYIDHFDARVDQQVGAASTLTTRYSFGDRRLLEPFASLVSVPGYGTRVPRRAQNLAVSLVHPFGSSLINETRFGYNRVAIGVFQQNQGGSLNRQVGLPELSVNPRDHGLSYITVSGFGPLGDEFTTPQESATDMYHVLNTATWVRNAHLIKVGGDLRHVRQSAYRDVQSRGFLNFSDGYITGNALADLLLGYPVVAGGATLDNPQRLRNTAWSAFVQDSFRLRPDLTLSAGLRYEYVAPAVDAEDRANLYDPASGQFVRVGTGGMPRGGYESDRNNWAPRIGLAWTPDAAGRTVLRGGYGVYYNQGALATGEGLYFNPPYFDLRINVPFEGVTPFTLTNPFPQAYPVRLPASATAYERELRSPWFEHWSFGVQRQFGRSTMIEAAYVGSRGHDLIAARDINQPRPSASPFNPRPNPQVDDITLIESRGRSNYNALQLKFDQRFDRGLSVLGAYTFAKSLDDASGFFASSGDPNFPQDSNNPKAEYARSSFDIRQRLSLSFGWTLPFADSLIFRDVELQGIFTAQAGRPFTVALLPEFDNSHTGRSTLGFGANDRPNLAGNPRLDDPSPDRWFNTAAFPVPASGSFGDAGRNILEGPGYQNMNLALVKQFALPGETRLQVRLESFNLFNRANFNLPDAFVGSPTFGRVVSADNPRRCQFGVRLVF
jgi:hypothetical protein